MALTQEQIWSKVNFCLVYLFIDISGTILLNIDEKSLYPNLRFFLSGLLWPQRPKGQLISKGLFGVFVSTKKTAKFLWTSALDCKKSSNQKTLLYNYVK